METVGRRGRWSAGDCRRRALSQIADAGEGFGQICRINELQWREGVHFRRNKRHCYKNKLRNLVYS